MGWSHASMRWKKIGRDISGARSHSPIPGSPAQGSSAWNISPHNFWLQKPEGIKSVEEILESQEVPLNETTQTNLFRLTLYVFQHRGSSFKGTRGTQGENEVYSIKVSRGHCSFSKPSPWQSQSWQAGAISETPSTWLTLFDLPGRSTETPSHPAGLSEPQGQALAAASLDSELGLAWKSLSPAQVAAISHCSTAQAGWRQAEHRWWLTLACTTWEPQGQRTQCTATDQLRAPPPYPCTADPPWKSKVDSQWSQPVLAADWPG